MSKYELHPAAELFPMMSDDEYNGLKQDIAENGQRESVVIWCGKLIDGRNRLRACEELGQDPIVDEIDESIDPWKYVLSHNLHRRHLSTSQRATVAAKLATLQHGGDRGNQHVGGKVSNDTLALDDAAKQLNVGRATVARAKIVQEHGSEAIKQAVEQGEIPVSFAARFVTEEPDKKMQNKLLKQGKEAMKAHITEPNPFIEDPEPEAESETSPISNAELAVRNASHIQAVQTSLNAFIRSLDSVPEVIGMELYHAKLPKLKQLAEPIRGAISACKPYAICPRCDGECCPQCGNMGWVSSVVNKELS